MGCGKSKVAQPGAKTAETPPATAPAEVAPADPPPAVVEQDPENAGEEQAPPEPVKPLPPEDEAPVQEVADEKPSPGDWVIAASNGGCIEGEVVKYSSTEVQVRSKDGQERCFAVEEIVQHSSAPPPATEVQVEDIVTTFDGSSGTVLKRTNNEVCLRTPDGEEKWCDVEDITVVKVSIVSAAALHHAGWVGESGPYCTCQLGDKEHTKVQTPVVSDHLDPTWDFEARLIGYVPGDAVHFEVRDKGTATKDDLLGRATLTSDQFLITGFCGDLLLLDASGKSSEAKLHVRIRVDAPPQTGSKAEDTGVPFVAAVKEARPVNRGWCC